MKMIGRSRNEQMVLNFLEATEVSATSVKIDAIHKKFLVIAKYVDLIIEPTARWSGIDIYKRARNVATANLLYFIGPVFLTPQRWNDFLDYFSNLVWKRDILSWSKLMSSAESICREFEFKDPSFADHFMSVLKMKKLFKLFISKMISGNELDPIPSTYTFLANAWGKQLNDSFGIVADESKVLTAYKETLLKLSDPQLKKATVGYDTRTMEYPLRVNSIQAVSSLSSKEVQFADILAGATSYCLKSEDATTPGTFANKIGKILDSKALVPHMMWPEKKFSPRDLGAGTDCGGLNLSHYTSRILAGDPSVWT